MRNLGISSTYIHSEVKTLDRVEILESLRRGQVDVLIGVNLLREGLDLPEVSLVAIMDADKEGFLRSERSLTQTIGRAARNVRGRVVMYADKITDSMRKTIDETERRRELQMKYNEKHGIIPETVQKQLGSALAGGNMPNSAFVEKELGMVADTIIEYMDATALKKAIVHTKAHMLKAAKEMDFMEAARLRDEMKILEAKLKKP